MAGSFTHFGFYRWRLSVLFCGSRVWSFCRFWFFSPLYDSFNKRRRQALYAMVFLEALLCLMFYLFRLMNLPGVHGGLRENY